MAEKDGKDGDRLRQFLARADLEQYLEPLRCLGAGKIAHLQDMRACDFDEIGMSGLEQARLKRVLKEESKWRWARLGEKVSPKKRKYKKCFNDRRAPVPCWPIGGLCFVKSSRWKAWEC